MTTVAAHHDAHAHEDRPAFLKHHWDTPEQQFEAGKLGMWLFLATEVLLFGGLFCGYSLWRGNHPEMFKYGSQFLDTKWGAINTAVLILSSLTMAWGVTCAQRNYQFGLKLCLILTWLGAATFMGIKYVEYSHKFHLGLYPGIKFYAGPPHGHDAHAEHPQQAADSAETPEELTGSHFDQSANPSDASSTESKQSDGGTGFQLETISITMHGPPPLTTPPVEATTVKPPPMGPPGLAPDARLLEYPFDFHPRKHLTEIHPVEDPHRPANAHMFFNFYFMMTGLHGLHVLFGMVIIGWLFIKACLGRFSAAYFTPVDLGGLYWHIVDLIWIFLFPLFYLI